MARLLSYFRRHFTLVLAFVIAAAGVSYGAMNSGTQTGVIHGCVNKSTGTLRISRTSHCRRSERGLAWNSRGLPGVQGAKGDPGPSGIAGAARIRGQIQLPGVSSQQTFDVPLTGNVWTQRAGQLNLISGRVDFSAFPCAGAPQLRSLLHVYVDGHEQDYLAHEGQALPAGPSSNPFEIGPLFEPSSDASHTLAIKLAYPCTQGTTATVAIDVVAGS
jgi:hypothetical protein